MQGGLALKGEMNPSRKALLQKNRLICFPYVAEKTASKKKTTRAAHADCASVSSPSCWRPNEGSANQSRAIAAPPLTRCDVITARPGENKSPPEMSSSVR